MRTFKSILIGVSSLLFLTASTCEGEDEEVNGCNDHRKEVIEYAERFTSNPTSANCEAYIGVLKRFHESGCPDGAGYDQEYRDMFECSSM